MAYPAERSSAEVLRALADQPGGAALLALAQSREDLVLVGGAVRDLLLMRAPRELDVTVAAGAAELAELLAAELGSSGDAERPRTIAFERFGTACVEWGQIRIDIAERRRESYRHPGALPDVAPGDLSADLARRDFTINAIALPLGGATTQELQSVEHGLQDLQEGRLRVLHEQSFSDDPTRLLRLARYSGRLGFDVELRTAELARQALTGRALQSVSGARIGAELWLAVCEADPIVSIMALDRLGVLAALGLAAPFDRELAEEALELLPPDGSRAELLMAVLVRHPTDCDQDRRAEAGKLLDGFEIPADARERILAGAFDATSLAERLEHDLRPSDLAAILARAPVEVVAIVGALAAASSAALGQAVARWLGELREVRLHIDGDDLIAAGVGQGPQIGRRLARALQLKLDGEIPDSAEAELQAALEAPE